MNYRGLAVSALALAALSAAGAAHARFSGQAGFDPADLSIIRVVLSDSKASVQAGGSLQWYADGREIGATSQPTEVKLAGGRVKMIDGKRGVEAARLTAVPADGYARFSGKDWRGRLEFFVSKDADSVVVLNVLPLEDYLLGVVPAEMPYNWPAEALKAQAIAARTYAVRSTADRRKGSAGGAVSTFDVYSDVSDQVYGGVASEHQQSSEAVKQTAGVILTYDGYPAFTQFCADCGGITKQGKFPYLRPAVCVAPESPHNDWKVALSREQLLSLAAKSGTALKSVDSAEAFNDPVTGHLQEVRVSGGGKTATLKGNSLRSWLGLNKMKSTRASIQPPGQASLPAVLTANLGSTQLPAPGSGSGFYQPGSYSSGAAKNSAVDVQTAAVPPRAGSTGLIKILPHFKMYMLTPRGVADGKLRNLYAYDGSGLIRCRGDVFILDADGDPSAGLDFCVRPEDDPEPVSQPAASAGAPLPPAGEPVRTKIDVPADGIVLRGMGYGHGVGLSQWGARTLAEQGRDYKSILLTFYSGVEFSRIGD